MKPIIKRSITGAVFVTVLATSICWNIYSFFGLFLVISLLGVWEFYRLCNHTEYSPQKLTGILGALVIAGVNFAVSMGYISFSYFAVILLFIVAVYIRELYRNHSKPFSNIAMTILPWFYIVLPFDLMLQMSLFNNQFNYHIPLSLFVLIWTNDTFAYLSGMTLGRTKLFERISPKKTWEGTIGGGLFTLVAGWIFSLYFNEIALYHWLVIAIITVIFGTLGDLTESLFKRSINVKDSGNILPGHGGILDRFDSILMATPMVYVYVKIFIT